MNEGGGQCAFVMFSTYPLGGGRSNTQREKPAVSRGAQGRARVTVSQHKGEVHSFKTCDTWLGGGSGQPQSDVC